MRKQFNIFFFLLFIGPSHLASSQTLPAPIQVRSSWLAALGQRRACLRFSDTDINQRALSWILMAMQPGRCSVPAGEIYLSWRDSTYVYAQDLHALKPCRPPFRWPDGPRAPMKVALWPVEGMSSEALWQWRGYAGQCLNLAAQAAGYGVAALEGWAFAVGVPAILPQTLPRKLGRAQKALLAEAEKYFGTALNTALQKEVASPSPVLDETAASLLAWSAYGQSFYQDGEGRVHRTVASAWNRYALSLMRWQEKRNLLSYRIKKDWAPVKGVSGEALWQVAAQYIQGEDQNRCFLLTWDSRKEDKREAIWAESSALRLNLEISAALLGFNLRWVPLPAACLEGIAGWEGHQHALALAVWDPSPKAQQAPAGFADGDYEGESGQWPRMRVLATFSGGRLSDLEILENESDDQYIDPVLDRLPGVMLAKNTWDVDAVSGASLTSVSLIQAVRDACAKARRASGEDLTLF